MLEQVNAEEARIKALLEGWADAVRRHDLSAILAHHEPDMVMFDLPPPLQCRGIEAYEQTWDLFFRYPARYAVRHSGTHRYRGRGRRLRGRHHVVRT